MYNLHHLEVACAYCTVQNVTTMSSCLTVPHLVAYISYVWKTFLSTVGCDGNICTFGFGASLWVEHQNRLSFIVANSKAALELDVFLPTLTHWIQ